MKESILRAAAIASLALALIMSVTTWVGLSTSSQRGSFFIGFFEFALILFLGVVAWALLNALADVVTVRTSVDVLGARMRRIEEALGVAEPAAPEAPGGRVAGKASSAAGKATPPEAAPTGTTPTETTPTETTPTAEEEPPARSAPEQEA